MWCSTLFCCRRPPRPETPPHDGQPVDGPQADDQQVDEERTESVNPPIPDTSPSRASLLGPGNPRVTPKSSDHSMNPSEDQSGISKNRIWTEAYDKLYKEDEKLVGLYEKTLKTLGILQDSPTDKGQGCSQGGNTGTSRPLRWKWMDESIEITLERTEKEAKIKRNIGEATRIVDSLRGLVQHAVKSSPEASLAMTGVGLIVEILANPVSESAAQRDGIEHIVKRMNWYWHLTDTLFPGKSDNEGRAGLQGQLRERVVGLYMKLLRFQMRSICVYHQNRVLTTLGDFVKYNDWAEKVQEIKNAETSFSNDFKQYATERGQQTLEQVVKELQDTRQHQDDKECRELVAQTVPFITKQAIIDKKGGELITTCCDWLFERSDFQQWQQDPAQKVLWISGDAGKGKTMMMCAMIDWFQSRRGLSYFFCVETNSNLNNQAAILRGLIYTITLQIPQLFKHVRENQDALRLQGEDVEVALFNTLKSIVEDPLISDGILLIDALDECRGDIDRILNLIDATWSSTTKWILSSRNKMTTLEKRFGSKAGCLRLSLDESLPSEAVTRFVKRKLGQFQSLWKDEAPDEKTLKEIENRLVSKSSGTYLWAALVLSDIKRDLEREDPIGTVVDFIKERVEQSPPSLTLMYGAMIQQLSREKDSEFYKDILKIVFIADRPLSLEELQFLANKQELRKVSSKERLRRIFLQGSSLLTIQNDTVTFIHQSAKDFISENGSKENVGILPEGPVNTHRDIFCASIKILSQRLEKNIYRLVHPGASISETTMPDPDPLAPVKYSCVNWVNHLIRSDNTKAEPIQEIVHSFLSDHFLHWVEALSLLREVSAGIRATEKLKNWPGRFEPAGLESLIEDAHRFFLKFRNGIEDAPLQVYTSGLVFAPTCSLVKRGHLGDFPAWISHLSGIERDWNTYSVALEVLEDTVVNLAFWDDNQRLSSIAKTWRPPGSSTTLTTWNAITGGRLHEIRDLGTGDTMLSRNGGKFAWVRKKDRDPDPYLIQVWDGSAKDATTIQYDRHGNGLADFALSKNGQYLIAVPAGENCSAFTVWDTTRESSEGDQFCRREVECVPDLRRSPVFLTDTLFASHDGQSIYVEDIEGKRRNEFQVEGEIQALKTSRGNSLRLLSITMKAFQAWDIKEGKCLRAFPYKWGHLWDREDISLSEDGSKLALVVDPSQLTPIYAIDIWQLDATPHCIIEIECGGFNNQPTLSKDAKRLASCTYNRSKIAIWDAMKGTQIHVLECHTGWISPLDFSRDGRRLASGASGSTILTWELMNDFNPQTKDVGRPGGRPGQDCLAVSPNGHLCSWGADGELRMWEKSEEGYRGLLATDKDDWIVKMVFSFDGLKLAVARLPAHTIEIWDVSPQIEPMKLHSLDMGPSRRSLPCMAFSKDGSLLAASVFDTLRIWSLEGGKCLTTRQLERDPAPKGHWALAATFLEDCRYLAVAAGEGNIWLTDSAGNCRCKTNVGNTAFEALETVGSGELERLVSASCVEIRIWDVTDRRGFKCLHILDVGGEIFQLLRDPGNYSILNTNRGILDLSEFIRDKTGSGGKVNPYSCLGYGLSSDMAWIMADGKNAIWLPPEYRPSSRSYVALWRTKMVISCKSGSLLRIHFSEDGEVCIQQ